MQHDDIDVSVEGLIQATLDAGAPDNVTVLIVEALPRRRMTGVPMRACTDSLPSGVVSLGGHRPNWTVECAGTTRR